MKLYDSQDERDDQGDEQVTLFPSVVYYDVKRRFWRAIVQGRVCDVGRVPMSTRLLIKGLKRALKASDEELAGDIFRERIQGFAAKPLAGRRIAVEIGGHYFPLRRRSKRNGTFLGFCKLPEGILPVPTLLRADGHGEANSPSEIPKTLTVRLVAVNEKPLQPSALESMLHVIPPRGLSVVSDIDDTIKATDVSSRHSMLTNTFLRPFSAIVGMAELYREWQASGAEFHYVSSSPWQLFQPLAELCALSDFPTGSMHLRYFRIRDEMFKRLRPGRRKGKAAIIAGLMKKLPERKFILVGDSGERDAEIYHMLAKRFPEQVTAILIRQLDAKPLSPRRLQKMHELAPRTRIQIYQTADELRTLSGELIGKG